MHILAAYYNVFTTYEIYWLDIVLNISLQNSLLASLLLLLSYKQVFFKTLQKIIFVACYFFSYLRDLAKSHLILKNQYVRKLISLGYICRNEFLNILRKLTLLFQLFSKFWENVIWPMKAKSTGSAKIFFREIL